MNSGEIIELSMDGIRWLSFSTCYLAFEAHEIYMLQLEYCRFLIQEYLIYPLYVL